MPLVRNAGEMGMRLIDAYDLQDKIHKSKMQNPHKDAKTATNHELEHDHFMQMVAFQPTAQEEIVRCKDCKFWQSRVSRIIDGKECNLCEMVKGYKPADWFCADGKRR